MAKVSEFSYQSDGKEVNAQGGVQHRVEERCMALFPRAQLAIARLRKHGHEVDGYADENYKCIEPGEHVDRALRHIFKWMAGDTEDGYTYDHLIHAACRLEMALEIILSEEEELRRERNAEQLRPEYGYGKSDHD